MRIVLMLSVALLAAACSKPGPTAVGKWETTAGLAGGTLILEMDGTGQLTSMSPLSLKSITKPVTWQKEGDRITLITGNQTEIITLSPDGQTLTVKGDSNQVEFRRVREAQTTK